jgi:hypothetical protein
LAAQASAVVASLQVGLLVMGVPVQVPLPLQ